MTPAVPPALLAETLHTVADAGNEVFLWVALRRAPDATHPLGYGPERYYWALLAAVGMFVVGGTLSVWDGVNALIDPRPLEDFWVGVGGKSGQRGRGALRHRDGRVGRQRRHDAAEALIARGRCRDGVHRPSVALLSRV